MNRYLAASVALFFLLAAQKFQNVAFAYWIPAARTSQESLATYLLPVDQARAALVGLAILLLIVPYLVIALRYFSTDPVFSLLGFVFGVGFIGAECAQRSIDFFLVGARWARELNGSSGIGREILLRRFDLWNDITAAWYFPLLLAHLFAACCFLRVTSTEWRRGGWFRVAPCAFLLNALRLAGRMLSMFAGQTWLEGFSGNLYFPSVLAVNLLLIGWFLCLYRQDVNAGTGAESRSQAV
jgi:hypothetical protein